MIQSHEQRTCKECGFVGPPTDFATYTKRDGTLVYRHVCLGCRRRKMAEYHKKRKAAWEENPPEPVDEGPEKHCLRCETLKPISEFPRMEKGRRTRPECHPCYRLSMKEWRGRNPDRTRKYHAAAREKDPGYVRRTNIKRYFKLTLDEWESLFDGQGRVCAVCGTDEPGSKNWHTDHDHSCCPGRNSCGDCIRGIVCQGCNLTLGQANDDPAILQAMIDYLTADRRPALRAI